MPAIIQVKRFFPRSAKCGSRQNGVFLVFRIRGQEKKKVIAAGNCYDPK
jgi:hypothetical protein